LASIVTLPPGLTVILRCQDFIPDFSIRMLNDRGGYFQASPG